MPLAGLNSKYTLEDEDGSTVELTEQQYRLVQNLNNNWKKLHRDLKRDMAILQANYDNLKEQNRELREELTFERNRE